MSDNMVPFNGIYQTKDGKVIDLLSGEDISGLPPIQPYRAPFYGRFIDKDGVEHDLSELIGSGGGGEPGPSTGVAEIVSPPSGNSLTSDYLGKIVNSGSNLTLATDINQAPIGSWFGVRNNVAGSAIYVRAANTFFKCLTYETDGMSSSDCRAWIAPESVAFFIKTAASKYWNVMGSFEVALNAPNLGRRIISSSVNLTFTDLFCSMPITVSGNVSVGLPSELASNPYAQTGSNRRATVEFVSKGNNTLTLNRTSGSPTSTKFWLAGTQDAVTDAITIQPPFSKVRAMHILEDNTWVVFVDRPTNASVISADLSSHILEDSDVRWPSIVKSISDLRAELKQFVVDTYAGITPTYDYSQTQTILMAGGLVSLVDQGTWTVPTNGAIQAQVGGLLGAGLQVLVNGTTVWTAPLNLLVPLNSPEIPVNAGDVISYTGVVGLGQTVQVDYFPNKGA